MGNTLPRYKIETYTGAVLDHSIGFETSGGIDTQNIHIRSVLNGIGTFSFTLPTVEGLSSQGYVYTDIALGDTAKFYFWYADNNGTCSATPDFIGKVCKITGNVDKSGYKRVIEGKLLGEVLERRLKTTYFYDRDASVAVEEIASDLSLGDGVAADTNHIKAYTDRETYLSLLKTLSDYYVDATHTVKKDWYVDVSNNLNWVDRPIRTAGVSTPAIGEGIIEYTIFRDVESVKNRIQVFGVDGYHHPPDDSWTEASTADWTGFYDTTSFSIDNADFKQGAGSLKATTTTTDNPDCGMRRTVGSTYVGDRKDGHDSLHFWYKITHTGVCSGFLASVSLLMPDFNHYFVRSLPPNGGSLLDDTWYEWDIPCGPTATADWIKGIGSDTIEEDWNSEVAYIFWRTLCTSASGTLNVLIDGLYFHDRQRYWIPVNDTTSQTAYGIRELCYTNPNILTDLDCRAVAESLLWQLKDPPIRADITVPLDTNIKIGDRIPLTIPVEGLSASNFDVLQVAHNFTDRGAVTLFSAVSAGNIRKLPARTALEATAHQFSKLRETAMRGREVTY